MEQDEYLNAFLDDPKMMEQQMLIYEQYAKQKSELNDSSSPKIPDSDNLKKSASDENGKKEEESKVSDNTIVVNKQKNLMNKFIQLKKDFVTKNIYFYECRSCRKWTLLHRP